MRILIDINHPAHVHLFRNPAALWEARGHDIRWVARDKEVVVALMRHYGLAFDTISSHKPGLVSLAREMLVRDARLLAISFKFRPDVLVGTSVNITHAGRIGPGRSLYFTESDPPAARLISKLAFPFAHCVVTPDCVPEDVMPRPTRARWKTYPSYHELAYLHPDRFSPDPSVLAELGVQDGEPFFVVRFIAWGASHDMGQGGLDPEGKRRLVDLLSSHGRVFITSEAPLDASLRTCRMPIAPHRVLDAMHYATMVVGDSNTMTAEAAVLGTPALRCNSMVGRYSYLRELEGTYRLAYGFRPSEYDRMMSTIGELLGKPDLEQEWTRRRNAMLSEKIDAANWIADFVEDYAAGRH